MELKLQTEKGEKFVADLVKLAHISIITYMTFGWIIPNKVVWFSITLMTPALHIHWKTNDNKCILTTIEKKLRRSNSEKGTFIGGLSKTFLNIELSDSMVSKLAHVTMYSSMLICIVRLYLGR